MPTESAAAVQATNHQHIKYCTHGRIASGRATACILKASALCSRCSMQTFTKSMQ